MTRKEHLDWCKERALKLCDEGKSVMAWIAFKHDLCKHEETAKGNSFLFEMGDRICRLYLQTPDSIFMPLRSPLGTMREFIEGFN